MIQIDRPAIYSNYDADFEKPFKERAKVWTGRNCTKELLKNRLKVTTLSFGYQFVGYKMSTFASDLIAGLTVAFVRLPQGMAYALLAGLPPQYGLYER